MRRHLEKALGTGPAADSRGILVTERRGYSLRLGSGDTDVRDFHRIARTGAAAFEDGDFRSASMLLDRALRLWRGPMLSDLQYGPLLALDALALEDARNAALNRRIEADLRLGRHMEVVGELRTLSIGNPINEHFAAQYMMSLYHSGRVAPALAEFQRIRNTLISELGVEPAPRLRRLQEIILTGGQPLEDPVLMAMP